MQGKVFALFLIGLTLGASSARQIKLDSSSGRIVGGVEAEPHSFPHQVALRIKYAEGTAFCGGSLIGDRWILSAAHCVDGADSDAVTVTLGAHDISASEDSQQVISSHHIIIHEKWNSTLIRNDVSLIHLAEAPVLNEFVQIAPLASVEPAVDSIVTLSGWGLISDEATSVSDTLNRVDVPVISDGECKKTFLVIPNYDQLICSSGLGELGACNGDSGGPMNYEGTVTGIASFVSGAGCDGGKATAYVSVPYYRDWILENTGMTA